MVEAEEPQFSTLAERIAALNRQRNFNSSSSPPSAQAAQGRKPPPPPPLVAAPRQTSAEDGAVVQYAPPPVRRQPGPPPSLPPRRPSGQHLQSPAPGSMGRRPSSESVVSSGSTTSMSTRTLSRVSSNTSQSSGGDGLRKMAPAFGTTQLPPLPPTKREREAAKKEASRKVGMQRAARQEAEREDAMPRTAPALPSRPASNPRPPPHPPAAVGPPPALPARRPTAKAAEPAAPTLPKRHTAARSVLEMGFSSGKPVLPRCPSTTPDDDDADSPPPPLPIASRPSPAQIHAAFRGVTGGSSTRQASTSGIHPRRGEDVECMICRDFSAPDEVASRYPLSVLPRQDTVAYLARQLCGGFASPTDKARAIFTWCHHNIAYDVDGFFNGCIPRGQSVAESIFSGKAVCEGYAKIYEGLARAAGLECIVISGHGKGFGFALVLPGQPVPPPNPTGHAWNAVRIDGGEWKLLDACWGAGNVSDKRTERYEKKFNPTMFTMSNEEFGERHFPSNPAYFFRADGRVLSWAEYVIEKSADPPVTLYSNLSDQFIGPQSVEPSRQSIHVRGGDDMVHFRFGRPCPHWNIQTHGQGLQPYLMQIQVHSGGADGRSDEMFEVYYDAPMRWWVDIPRRKLGRPGDTITCFSLTQLNGRDMRGATLADFEAPMRQRKTAMVGICMWKLV